MWSLLFLYRTNAQYTCDVSTGTWGWGREGVGGSNTVCVRIIHVMREITESDISRNERLLSPLRSNDNPLHPPSVFFLGWEERLEQKFLRPYLIRVKRRGLAEAYTFNVRMHIVHFGRRRAEMFEHQLKSRKTLLLKFEEEWRRSHFCAIPPPPPILRTLIFFHIQPPPSFSRPGILYCK